MKSFSQRVGLKPIKSIIQRESVDEELRTSLWNVLTVYYWNHIHPLILSRSDEAIRDLLTKVWIKYYKKRLDELPNSTTLLLHNIKADFFNSSWNEMFDMLEFIPNNCDVDSRSRLPANVNNDFIVTANKVLEENLSAYRFVDYLIVEISSEEEIKSIEEAISVTSKYNVVQTHLRRAMELLGDRKNPDYRNSIKESISAVEAFSIIITNNPKATLGQALKEIEKTHNIHSALKNAFSNLYGYTSEGDGIRHSLLEESTLKQEDAKFMLVVCSAFINYLLVKASE